VWHALSETKGVDGETQIASDSRGTTPFSSLVKWRFRSGGVSVSPYRDRAFLQSRNEDGGMVAGWETWFI